MRGCSADEGYSGFALYRISNRFFNEEIMKFEQQVTINVNGKTITATVQLNAPGLTTADGLSPQMILSASATGRNTQFHSRHYADRVASIEVCPSVKSSTEVKEKPQLRLVA
jgi:hypothetical protein